MNAPLSENHTQKGFNYYKALSLFIVITLILTLPFHYVPEEFKMFPKENLTFSHTFIFNSDIDKVIKRYNDANPLNRIQLKNDPFIKKLFDEDLISQEKGSNTTTLSINTNNTKTEKTERPLLDTAKTFDPTGYYYPTDTTLLLANTYKFEWLTIGIGVNGFKKLVELRLKNINGGTRRVISFKNYILKSDDINLNTDDAELGKIDFQGKFSFKGNAGQAVTNNQIALTGQLYFAKGSKKMTFTYSQGD